jgi:LmbE family N-acetylglucosaminyl deacetylase
MVSRGTARPAALDDFVAALAEARDAGASMLMVVAHPDDEVIGLGGHFARLPELRIVHVTDGAPRDLRDARAHGFEEARAYALARRKETHAALHLSGIAPENLLSLDLPDQEAVLHLPWLSQRLAAIISEVRPRFVLTHPYEGGHPDHDATAFAVHAARAALGPSRVPDLAVVEMAFYHLTAQATDYQRFLRDPARPEAKITLDPASAARKQRLMACFPSQAPTLAGFRTDIERFREAPAYDFTVLPNGGRLQYEAWGLGQGRDWLRHARSALDELVPA